MIEKHKHDFQVADIGAWDLDEDRGIVPSIENVLKSSGIQAVVDGDQMNSAGFTVYTYSPRDVITKALEDDGIDLEGGK